MSDTLLATLSGADFTEQYGEITALGSDCIEANGPSASIGQFCLLKEKRGHEAVAEVVAVGKSGLRLVPLTKIDDLTIGSRVSLTGMVQSQAPGCAFSGRAVNGIGRPIDSGPAIRSEGRIRSVEARFSPLDRVAPKDRILTGIRAVDALIPLGKGQRIGIFAASGVGKTSLLEQLMWQTDCDRVVVCLVGERGREVEKLWAEISSQDNPDKFTLVAATADESASMRVRAVEQALLMAEYWRDQGEHCLLLVDSITRVAFALRELGTAAGDPPSSRGYTPNVFSALPKLVERCGAMRDSGAITAITTVLSETDDVDDPIVELMKSVLDGHIVLGRAQAERRHFPAIDIARSISRLSEELMTADQANSAAIAHRLHSTYEEARAMIDSGLYSAGSSREIDTAIAAHEGLLAFLKQPKSEHSPLSETDAMLAEICAGGLDAS